MFDFYANLILYFILGAIFGSFLSVVISRFDTKDGIILGRSRCPQCRNVLSAWELIPILSFVALRGRCRKCRAKIGFFYPILETVTGLVFAGLFLRFSPVVAEPNFTIFMVVYCLAAIGLIAIFFIDMRTYLIPDKIVLPGIILALVLGIFNVILHDRFGTDFLIYRPDFWQFVLGIIFGGGFFLFLVLVSKEKWMGWGDVKLGAFLGLLLGGSLILVALFFSFVLGALVSLTMMAFKKKTKKDIIPFAPFLILGFAIALFFGKFILCWYLGV